MSVSNMSAIFEEYVELFKISKNDPVLKGMLIPIAYICLCNDTIHIIRYLTQF